MTCVYSLRSKGLADVNLVDNDKQLYSPLAIHKWRSFLLSNVGRVDVNGEQYHSNISQMQ